MNVGKSLFGGESNGSGGSSSGSKMLSTTSKFYASVPPSAKKAAVSATSSALSTAAQNEKVQNAAANSMQSAVNHQLKNRAGMSDNSASFLSNQVGKGVPAAMNKASKNEKLMNEMSRQMLERSTGASFEVDSSFQSTSGVRNENKVSNSTSVEDLKQRLASLYGEKHTPKYIPPSSSSSTFADSTSHVGAAGQVTNSKFYVAAPHNPPPTSSFSSQSTISNNAPSSFAAYDPLRSNQQMSASPPKVLPKPAQQFADPFASYNRPQSVETVSVNHSAALNNHMAAQSNNYSISSNNYAANFGQSAADGDVYEALYDFDTTAADELCFRSGDDIIVTGKVNEEWWLGRLKAHSMSAPSKMFPANFIKLKEPKISFSNTQQKYMSSGTSNDSQERYCIALYDYPGECSADLAFRAGDRIRITKHIDCNWLEGEMYSHKGIFPANFVKIEQSNNFAANRSFIQQTTPSLPMPNAVTSTPAAKSIRRVMYDYVASNSDELTVRAGDDVIVLGEMPGCKDWLNCQLRSSGKCGFLPANYLS